jgi:hypothetical protein
MKLKAVEKSEKNGVLSPLTRLQIQVQYIIYYKTVNN